MALSPNKQAVGAWIGVEPTATGIRRPIEGKEKQGSRRRVEGRVKHVHAAEEGEVMGSRGRASVQYKRAHYPVSLLW